MSSILLARLSSFSIRPWALGCATNISDIVSCNSQQQPTNSCKPIKSYPWGFKGMELPPASVQKRYSTSLDGGPSQLVIDVLHSIQVQKLKEELRDESNVRLHISVEDFTQKALELGAAPDRAEALRLLSDLHRTGDVLRHADSVYLRASEIAEIVMMTLPGGREEARIKLSKIEAELKELEDINGEAEDKAKRITRRFLIAGGFILVVQFISFIWLTWFELSWDVMEPFGYIIQLFYQLVAYTYFLITNGKVFDLGPFRETWTDRFKTSIIKAKAKAFDQTRFQYLTRLKERYHRYLNTHLSDVMS